VEISYEENPKLRDKTDREGLIENEQFRDFVELIIGSTAALETERRKDKDQVDEWIDRRQATERIKGDAVEESINHLHRKMQREGDLPKYEGDLKTLRTRYQETLESLVDPLIVAAGLGISYTIPVHEITRNVKDLRSTLRAVGEDVRDRETLGRLEHAVTVLEQIDEMVRGAGRIIRKGRPENVQMFSAVKDAADIMRLRLEREGIAITTRETEPLQVRGRRNLIVTAILNLIDNSAYWLLLKEADKQVMITVDRSSTGEPRIVVADNGPGIQDDPALLVKPFFTRKSDGSGLGLYIVDRIMQAHEGKVLFLSGETGDDSLLSGANVALVFPPEKEVE
jgi:signal transduction histidine kinase